MKQHKSTSKPQNLSSTYQTDKKIAITPQLNQSTIAQYGQLHNLIHNAGSLIHKGENQRACQLLEKCQQTMNQLIESLK